MSQALLRGVLPVGMGLIVCTMGVLFLSAAGLLHEPAPAGPELAVAAADSVSSDSGASVAPPEPVEMTAAEKQWYPIGDALFKGNCAQCHAVHEQVVGPALRDIEKRRPEKWLQGWIKNSAKVVASGDPDAVAIYEKFGRQQMPSFQLSDKEISAILLYIQVEGKNTAHMGIIDDSSLFAQDAK